MGILAGVPLQWHEDAAMIAMGHSCKPTDSRAMAAELARDVDKALLSLRQHLRFVLCIRFGLGFQKERTLAEAAALMDIKHRDRVRQLEGQALRVLRSHNNQFRARLESHWRDKGGRGPTWDWPKKSPPPRRTVSPFDPQAVVRLSFLLERDDLRKRMAAGFIDPALMARLQAVERVIQVERWDATPAPLLTPQERDAGRRTLDHLADLLVGPAR